MKTYTEDISETSTSVYISADIKCFAGMFSKHFKKNVSKLSSRVYTSADIKRFAKTFYSKPQRFSRGFKNIDVFAGLVSIY